MISQNFKEFLIVCAVFTLVLLPVRLLFVEFVDSSTLGSIGVISIISIPIIILVKKQKLGAFGEMFERQMFRITHGKRRIFVACVMCISVTYFGFSLFAIEQGNTVYLQEKENVKAQLAEQYDVDFSNIESVSHNLEPKEVISGIPNYFGAIFYNFKDIAITQAIVNDYSNGMIQHFHTVFFIEGLEVIGIFIFSAFAFGKQGSIFNLKKPSKILIPFVSVGLVLAILVTFLPEDKSKLIEYPAQEETPPQDTPILRPTVIEKITNVPVEDGMVEKRFVHGDTEIIYRVGVENGVEKTPSPDVLRAMQASYSEEELEIQQKIIDEIVRNGPQGMGKVIGIKNPDGSDIYIDLNKAWKNTQIHTNNKLKKQYIDTNFTCENYHTLAKKFVGESMYGVSYAGSVENYIYQKAFNECIDTKYQEKLDKVYAELEEAN